VREREREREKSTREESTREESLGEGRTWICLQKQMAIVALCECCEFTDDLQKYYIKNKHKTY